jgi:ACS family glucarate transporter-like MFS transporter
MKSLQKRHLLVTGTFLLSVLLYIDRVCISAAKPAITESLGLSDTQMGWVLSIFALGYALFQTPSGILADRFGPRRVLTVVVTFWSIFTALTGAAFNYITMLIYRFLFGVGEAGAFPGIARAVYSWVPMKERGIVNGINFSGSRLGAAFALPLVAWLIETIGWRSAFLVLGVVGFVWAIFWWFWFRDDPTAHTRITREELTYILETRQQPDATQASILSIRTLLSSRNMWMTMWQYFCSNFTFFFALTWLFPHIKETYDLATVEAAFYASAPLIAGAFGHWTAGWLVDTIYKSGKWRLSRTGPATVGFALSAIGLVGSIYMNEMVGAIIFLSLAIFGADMTLSPSWSFCVDIGRRHSGAVSGTMNMAGNIGSFITALAFPYLLAWTGSTTPFFVAGAVLNMLAIATWLMMQPDRKIEDY